MCAAPPQAKRPCGQIFQKRLVRRWRGPTPRKAVHAGNLQASSTTRPCLIQTGAGWCLTPEEGRDADRCGPHTSPAPFRKILSDGATIKGRSPQVGNVVSPFSATEPCTPVGVLPPSQVRPGAFPCLGVSTSS